MEEIKRLFCKSTGSSGFITFFKVLAIELNTGLLITDNTEIVKRLYDEDTVCVYKFSIENPDPTLIFILQVEKVDKKDDQKYVVIKANKFSIPPQIISIDSKIVENQYLDLVSISNKLNSDQIVNSNDIYLSDDKRLYGPLKIEHNELKPKKNKEVSIYPLDLNRFFVDNKTNYKFYTGNLDAPKGQIDCMTEAQLFEFFKSKVANSKEEKELFNRIKKYIDATSDYSELDQIRLARVKSIIDQVVFLENEIDDILSDKSRWQEVFKNQIEIHTEKLRNSIKLDLTKEVDEINRVKMKVETEVSELQKKLESILSQISLREEDLRKVKENKDLIVQSIKIQSELGISSGLNQYNNNEKSKFFDFVQHSQVINSGKLTYDEKVNAFCDDDVERQAMNNFIDNLATKSLFYCSKVEKLISFLKIFNEYSVVFQNVEVDWIKYEKLFENGLGFISNQAIQFPERLHVLILNDFNVAAFELYAKPIIDLLQNKRTFIPGTNNPFPNNLKILLVESNISQNEDCFPSEVDLIKENVGKIDLDDIKFLRNILRGNNNYTPLLWTDTQ